MIHKLAVIDKQAEIDEDVEIGAFSVIGSGVKIAKGTIIKSHVTIDGITTIGKNNMIYAHAALGGDPQDLKYNNEPTILEIGDFNRIREYATIHRGTAQDQGITKIGNHNLIMVSTHIAHDCQLGNHVIMSNNASLAGHVKVDDWAVLSGFSLFHQFCHIGAHSFIGMGAAVAKDIPPYLISDGHPAIARGVNINGLKRREGFNPETIKMIREVYKILYLRKHSFIEAKKLIAKLAPDNPYIQAFSEFLENSQRGIIKN